MGSSSSARRVLANTDSTAGNEGLIGTAPASPSAAALKEAYDIMALAIPLFITSVSWVTMKVTDSAVLGHVGTIYLDSTALSDLWTSSTGVFIQSGVVGTFCGNAYGGGNKRLVGIWLQVSYVVLLTIMIPVAICWCFTGPLLRAMKNTEEESTNAAYFAMVLALCLPVRIGFSQLRTFFSAQKILRPSVIVSTSAMLMNLVGALVLVLGIPIPGWKGFGFAACPWVTTTVEYIQLFIMWFFFCYIQQLHRECWHGWDLKEVTRDRVVQFLKMYLPAALSIGSDFWRVAAIGAIAKTLGATQLGVFNVSYRICWMCLIFMGAIAGAVGTQLTIALGKGSVVDAKRSTSVGLTIAFFTVVILGTIIVIIPRSLGSIFSDDPEVLDLFEESRWPLASFAVLMNLAVAIERIPMAAGRVNAVFYCGLAGSWLGQVPGVIFCTQFWRKDLVGLFTGVSAGYALLVVLYLGIVLTLNWDSLVAEARRRAEVKPESNLTSLQPQRSETEESGEKETAVA